MRISFISANDKERTEGTQERHGGVIEAYGLLPAGEIEDQLQLDHRQEGRRGPQELAHKQIALDLRPKIEPHHDPQPLQTKVPPTFLFLE